MVKYFGPMVFIYSVVWFGSNVSVSICSTFFLRYCTSKNCPLSSKNVPTSFLLNEDNFLSRIFWLFCKKKVFFRFISFSFQISKLVHYFPIKCQGIGQSEIFIGISATWKRHTLVPYVSQSAFKHWRRCLNADVWMVWMTYSNFSLCQVSGTCNGAGCSESKLISFLNLIIDESRINKVSPFEYCPSTSSACSNISRPNRP